jgi:hypothetical protein
MINKINHIIKLNHIIYIFLLYINIFYIITPENKCTKTSARAHFWGVWLVVLAKGRPNHQKWLIFGGCGLWWWPEEGPTPENEHNCLFLGLMWGGGGGQMKAQPLKQSS